MHTCDFETFVPAWVCARTKPKHEHIAAGTVITQLGLEVFHPRIRLERATRRGPVRLVEPLFPGYLFVRCHSAEDLSNVSYSNGVSGLVRFGQRIATVPVPVVEELKECFENDETMVAKDGICPGSEVTIAEGPFLGFKGIVVRTLPARRRVQVLLDFLGRTTAAEFERSSLTVLNCRIADMMPALAAPQVCGAGHSF